MRTYRRTVTTDLAPDEVWAYLSDFTSIDEWDPRADDTRLVQGDGGVGSVYETHVHFLGRTTQMTYRVTRLEPDRTIEWIGDNGAVHAHDVIEVREEDGRTVVDYASSYDYKVAPALLDRLMSRPLDRLCDDAQQGLSSTLAAR